MSDSVKPEEKPVVLEGTNVVEEILTTPEAGPAAVTDEVTAVEADNAIEETTSEEKKEEKAEPKEITHGTLSKAHGGLLAFFKQKRFFYFQDEAISEDKLKTYLHKDTASLSTATYASQTGKGLLMYAKGEGQREIPHGIIKLADVTEVVPSGNNKFILKLATSELHFESPAVERDSWVFTLNHKITEAKATADEITSSESYKAAFERLSKPVAAVAVAVKAPEKTLDPKEQETEESEAKIDAASTPDVVEEDAAAADKKVDVKRSPSKKAKRTSVFAFLGDKKKKPEEKKDVSADKKEEDESKDETEADVAPIVAEASTDAPSEVKEAVEADEAEKAVEPTVAPKPIKRNSIFGAFSRERKEKEVEEDKKEEVKSEAAESSEPLDTEAKPIESTVETPVEKTPASSPPKPKFLSSFFDKKEKSPAVKTPEKETEVKSLEATGPTIEAPTEATESASVPVDDSGASDPTCPATSPKEQKRKPSFFASFKKDKKVEDVKSDSEDAEPAQKSGTTSPAPKTGLLTGLMRKASKSTKNAGKEADTKEVAAPETVAEEPTPVPATTETVETATTSTEPAVSPVGDAPETVTVAQAPVQATV